jgi:hypothetical protein
MKDNEVTPDDAHAGRRGNERGLITSEQELHHAHTDRSLASV